jgi:hypothetical protein
MTTQRSSGPVKAVFKEEKLAHLIHLEEHPFAGWRHDEVKASEDNPQVAQQASATPLDLGGYLHRLHFQLAVGTAPVELPARRVLRPEANTECERATHGDSYLVGFWDDFRGRHEGRGHGRAGPAGGRVSHEGAVPAGVAVRGGGGSLDDQLVGPPRDGQRQPQQLPQMPQPMQ